MAQEFVESIRYEADISDLTAKLKRIEDAHGDTETKSKSSTGKIREGWRKLTEGLGSTITTLAKVGGAFVGAGAALAVGLGPKVLEQGAALDALAKKSKTVFEGSLPGVQKWADGVAGAMGLTRDQLVGMAADTADLLKPMGFSADVAADMSTKTNELAAALSAWTGGQVGAKDASMILTKAYLGERDALTSLGIKISEADVQARLAANGQDELTGAALEQAKAVATQQLIFEKSTDAQKAWSDGSMDAVKQQNEMRAGIERLKEGFVKALFPVVQAAVPYLTQLADWLGERLPGAIDTVKAWFERNWPAIQATIAAVVDWLQNTAWPIVQTVFEAIRGALAAVVDWVSANWPTFQAVISTVVDWLQGTAWPIVQQVVQFIVDKFGELAAVVGEKWGGIRQTIAGVIDAVKIVIETTIAVIQGIWDRWGEQITAAVKAVWDGLKAYISSAIDAVRGIIDAVTSLIKGDWEGVWDGLRRFVEGVWEGIKAQVSAAVGVVKSVVSIGWDALKTGWEHVWGGIKDFFGGVWDWIADRTSDGVNAVVDFVKALPGKITDAVKGAFKGLYNAFADVVNKIINGWNGIQFTLPEFDTHIPGVGKIGGWTIGTPDLPTLPRLATGGVVDAPMLAVIGDNPNAKHDPEIVSPASMLRDIVRTELAAAGQNQAAGVGVDGPTALVVDGQQMDAYLARRERDRLRGAA